MLDPATEVIAEATHGYALTLEYDGTGFSGWQRQPDRRTVEGALLEAIVAVTGEQVRLTAAGRTDAGAHAHGQVVGCSLRRLWEPRRLRAALNAHLPEDAVVLEVRPAPDGFHARFDARTRTYRYLVSPGSGRAAVARDHAWRVPEQLDLVAMQDAAAQLVGTHDFAAFGRSPRAGGATVRTVHSLTVRAHRVPAAHGDPAGAARTLVTIDVTADAFLYGMMRAIAATLVAVGGGRLDPPSVASLLDAPRTARRLPTAPAHGLHQWAVSYEDPRPPMMNTQRTYQPSAGEVVAQWYVVDARGQTLGRLAVNIARVLRGKHRPQYTPHLLTGDHVIVVNARDIQVTGRKRSQKIYDRYSGYPGGRRERTFQQMIERHPTHPITHAVRGMLQHNSLGADQLRRLRVYAGAEHRHEAQQPQPITFGELGEIIRASVH